MKLHYFGGFFLLVFITSALLFIISRTGPEGVVHPLWWIDQLYFLVIGSIAHAINGLGLRKYKDSLHLFYMGSLTLRLLTALIFITVLLINVKDSRSILAFDFLGLYLLYTWFEIYFLLRNLRANFKNGDAIN